MKQDYVFIAIATVLMIAGIALLNPYTILASSIAVAAIYLLYRSWYMIDAVVFHHTNLIKVVGQHQLSKSGKVVTRREGGRYSATAIASISNIKGGEINRDVIENIISHTTDPFKYSLVLNRLDNAKMLEKLQTLRSRKEIELSRIENQSAGRGQIKSSRLKREIQQLTHDISSISSDSTPLKLAYYVSTTAVSENLYAAEERAKALIAKLSSEFAGALGAEYIILDGADLLAAIEIDSYMVLK